MSSLTANHTADPTWTYCAPSIVPRKTGRPKTEKRFKSPVELTKQKKAKVSVQQEMENESKKAARMKKGKTSQKDKEIGLSVKDGSWLRDGYFGHLVQMY